MGAAIGGRHTVMVAIIIRTLPRTVALTTGGMVIITQRLTMTLPREPMVGNRQPMALTDRRRAAPVTILILGLTLAVPVSRRLMGAGAQRKRTIRTLELMLRPGKVRARTPSGEAPTCREETRALPWVTTPPPMEQWQAPLVRREEKWRLPARSGETLQQAKPPAATCMLDTMATFTRTQVTAGRSTIMEAGTP
ncbi:MAG: hypothetical protein QOF94_1050 [Acidobacteriaceae bacterium]